MKFTQGMWRTREGIEFNWMGHAERVTTTDSEANILLTQPQRRRGDQLNKGTLTANIRSPLDGVTAVKLTHWDGADDPGPNFPLNEASPAVSIENKPAKSLIYSTGPLSLDVDTAPNSLSFTYNDITGPTARKLTSHSFRSLAYVSDANTSTYSASDELYAEKDNHILFALDLSVHEKIYGLGERFGPFVKNGQAIDIWNEDGGTSSELTYKNIPFYLSSRGYGVFVNHPGKIMLEVQSERTTRVNVAVQAESVEYMVVAGPTPKAILDRYTALTGRPGLPPAWSYGLWLTTSFTTSYDEATVTGFLDGFRQRDIPLSVFHFDSFWMKGFHWCDFEFDADLFPDPKAYLARLRERGIKVCVWINPYVGQASKLFREGKEKGYFVLRADTATRTVWQWDNWQAGMALVDFTNPAATEWYVGKLKGLMDLGVDAFKTDFGERIPFDARKIKYFDGSDPRRMHNFYSFLYNKAVYEGMQAHGKDACLFARSATTGGQRFPVHWGGDCESTYEAMAETLRGGLSLGLCGFGSWAHDIGGFEGLPDPGLYKRWVQFGLLGSHSRLHGSGSYRVPWIFEEKYPGEDEKCSKVLREAVRRKLSLMPYLLRVAAEAGEKGTPVMRAMLLEVPEDQNVWNVDTQYMLGDALLVAPVFDKDGWVRFYVPETEGNGLWRSWFDGKKTYSGGKWYEEQHAFDSLPLLVKPGAVVPVNYKLKDFEGDVLNGLELLVNGPLDSEKEVKIVEAKDVASVSKTLVVGKDLSVKGANGIMVKQLE
ncbi:uncharacterized protein HMPREF1541_02718 [Cyphellophora europaea CBS 101466]|uniref:alpha-D-xyloside xylohydrolase n=1 Tax=Cyphellophora europaea (strain CBS 101466) TaxID=1220924 RepID=W2S6K4_CYPE1|nr:uncharacterized protein HMPREF1541_02718 [Cyphellophora europaea CBS 101466]ETN43559.1 hypothetical protein HMPREF1541_02718 [Cyphellophora europaea CBS 101466]